MKFLAIALVALFAQSSFASIKRGYTCQLGTDARDPIAYVAVTTGHMAKGTVVDASVVEVKRPAKQGHRPSYGQLKSKECSGDRSDFTCSWTTTKEMQTTFKLKKYTLDVRLSLAGMALDATLTSESTTGKKSVLAELPCEINL